MRGAMKMCAPSVTTATRTGRKRICTEAHGEPDRRSLAKIRDAIAWKADEWKKRKTRLGSSKARASTRAPRGYAENHPLIGDLKRQDFVVSVRFSNALVCSPRFLQEVTAAAKKMSPLMRLSGEGAGTAVLKADRWSRSVVG